MQIMKWSPFGELDEIERQFFGPSRASSALSMPTMDVYLEDDKRIVAEVQIANFKPEEVEVSMHQGALEIRAEQKSSNEDKSGRKYVLQESSSSFYRSIRLPKNVDEDKIEAHFDDGLLKVVVPLKEAPKPSKIQIKSKKSGK